MANKRGRPLKDFEPEEDSPTFTCQLATCGKVVSKEEENWVRFRGLTIRICNKCYETYNPEDAKYKESEEEETDYGNLM
jgi:hypothetical protein